MAEGRISPAVVIGIGAGIGIAAAVGIYAIARAAPPTPPEEYTCPLCEATFSTMGELEVHFESAHPWTPIDIIWV